MPGGAHPYFQPWKSAGADAKKTYRLGGVTFDETAEWDQQKQNNLLSTLAARGYNAFGVFGVSPTDINTTWLAGGHRQDVPVYDTEGGWLHLTTDELVKGALQAQKSGWDGVKIKVGKPHTAEDAERLRAVREAVGPALHIMTDANQSQTMSSALRLAAALEPYDPYWIEEPLPADDISGHARLARATRIPVAVGESLYAPTQFRNYLETGAASIVQVDAARVGGTTPWLKVAHTAESHNVMVCPHFLMELHVSLVAAVPNGRFAAAGRHSR
ncbi:L-fuconate dehydratase [Streptomyces malaysiensis subsp. malaysiensis]|nr:L-fuconate dehydratase [Streptomyces sp. M56]